MHLYGLCGLLLRVIRILHDQKKQFSDGRTKDQSSDAEGSADICTARRRF